MDVFLCAWDALFIINLSLIILFIAVVVKIFHDSNVSIHILFLGFWCQFSARFLCDFTLKLSIFSTCDVIRFQECVSVLGVSNLPAIRYELPEQDK